MAPTIATAVYKKKDGTLTIAEDRKYVFWSPATPPSSPPSVTIPVADITNLQQTPATSKAIALKIVVGESSYVFTFNHKENARKEQENTTEVLRNTIAANKTRDASHLATPAAGSSAVGTPGQASGSGGEDGGASAAMAIAKAVSSAKDDEGWYDDAKLKSDISLQRSLLESDRALQERFNQALKDKPESVSIAQFTSQFWSARLHLLRAHAIEKAQKQGEYNVLPEIKFKRAPAEKQGEPDTVTLTITKEQIHLIFKQYPIVREAYNDIVPGQKAHEFWTDFFNSRLLKKLKGEKILQTDKRFPKLDQYLDREVGGPASIQHIPHWMDLEGNEQNHSQRKGNRPDQDMRPTSTEKVPILRVLNNLSEKMMSHVAPEDGEAHAPVGLDEETFEQLRLRDLASEDVDNRVRLSIKEQQRYVGGDKDTLSADAKLYAKQDSTKVLESLSTGLQPRQLGTDVKGTLRLNQVIGYHTDDESDSDDEDRSGQTNGATARKPKIGSHSAMSSASAAIMSSIKTRRNFTSAESTSLNGLSQDTYDSVVMTHNTTNEFLHYFWSLFLSGDASRTAELAQLVSTLDRSLDRINAVAAQAESERAKQVESVKRQVEAYYQRTGKRRKVDYDTAVPGGKKAVEAMVKPTVQALAQASTAYRKAFEEQSKEAAATASV
ncbi:Putative BSD domain, PH-like domain superfamily, TFIIH p62 subunit, TFIIH subunit Tfb1/GTF2H1 [Septoria linicola]|uniref:BSD domain, PH-like domain superfamily, TFIIH p62 subunit, TFIIH subunit Tfb1/GTF2H1 n=1 Tax=Septoria linicola TaxID=215465 RepID=A0A9Q9EJQ1_9PEZI|nr:putative BSD domain, PH-like domain superfamily, TFIIH p62 subunit, TFIIH subunit Tfb1/GTF2H1 [Septoria linicola]USW52454.1 Putative BSD domain, PH-like domain superfamily, TFIIH p62 subunit, TFIIH subunit Tfb1/GTF2H1 [Septoria linicola]